jgi:hypothetical protein
VMLIREIDVVGTRNPLVLASQGPSSQGARSSTRGAVTAPTTVGVAVPRFTPPAGTVILARIRVHGWVVARFGLTAPLRATLDQLTARARNFFHHGAPQWVLAFLQSPGR